MGSRRKSKNLLRWLKSGEYLPLPLRDFHAQKDMFKRVEEMVSLRPIPQGDSWVGRHIYVVDYFLWFMARHGYTLQKTRQSIQFEDLDATINEFRTRTNEAFAKAIAGRITEKANGTNQH